MQAKRRKRTDTDLKGSQLNKILRSNVQLPANAGGGAPNRVALTLIAFAAIAAAVLTVGIPLLLLTT